VQGTMGWTTGHRLSRSETKGTSVVCPQCGERLQEDRRLRRKLWCGKCRTMTDRDVVAAINLSQRGRLRFDRSRAHEGPQGGVVEAVKGNPTTTVLLRDRKSTRLNSSHVSIS